MTTDEYRVNDARILHLHRMVAGGGIVYGISRKTRNLVEFDVSDPARVSVSGVWQLPFVPMSVCMTNVAAAGGVRASYYFDEWLRDGVQFKYALENLDYTREASTSHDWGSLERFPVLMDWNHYGIEFDFWHIAPFTGDYEFAMASDDGMRTYWNDEVVAQYWRTQSKNPDSPFQQWTKTLRQGQRSRIHVEHADAKSFVAGVTFYYRAAGSSTWIVVPADHLRQVMRTGRRIDSPLLKTTEEPGDVLGTEVSPDIGGAVVAGAGRLYVAPYGPGYTGQLIEDQNISGRAVCRTSWGYILNAAHDGVQLRDSGYPEQDEYHNMPFDVAALVRGPDDYVFAIGDDGQLAVLDCTDDVEMVTLTRMAHVRNVVDAFYYEADGESYIFTVGEKDSVVVTRIETEDRWRVFHVERDRYASLNHAILYGRNIPDVGVRFLATDDADDDDTIVHRFKRTQAVPIRKGFLVAHEDTGAVTVYSDTELPNPIGIDFPLMPAPEVRYSFVGQEGDTDGRADEAPSADYLWSSNAPSVIQQHITIELSTDNVTCTLPDELAPPFTIAVEHEDIADGQPGVTDPATYWPFYSNDLKMIAGFDSGESPDSWWSLEFRGEEVPQIATGFRPYTAGSGLWRQCCVTVGLDYVEMWIGGTLVRAKYGITDMPATIDVASAQIGKRSWGSAGDVAQRISDVRYWLTGLSSRQAKAISGGRLFDYGAGFSGGFSDGFEGASP